MQQTDCDYTVLTDSFFIIGLSMHLEYILTYELLHSKLDFIKLAVFIQLISPYYF